MGRIGDMVREKVPSLPSGSWALDRALGVGGYPLGRIIELFGPEMSGKTTLTLHAVAMAQASGSEAAFVDAEHALDLGYAEAIGVDVPRLVVSQPDCGEQALAIVEDLVKSRKFAVVVVDSVAALVPKAELDGEMGASHPGLQARLMSQALRKLTGVCSKTGTAVMFINQMRMKIGVMFGSPETTTGGQALKFYASVRIDARRREKVHIEGKLVGNLHQVKVVKNKLAPPFQECMLNVVYGRGIDRYSDLAEVALDIGAITKSGSWYAVKFGSESEQQLCQGRFKLVDMLKEDAEVRKKVAAKCVEICPRLRWLP